MDDSEQNSQNPIPAKQRYSAMREVLIPLNSRLIGEGDLVHPKTAARALGIEFRNGTLIFENDLDLSLLAEYSIYHHVSKGTRLFERVMERDSSLSEAEREILEAQRMSFVSLWEVKATRPDDWEIDLADLLGEQGEVTILDQGLSSCLKPGAILHERILPFDGFCCGSGAGLALLFPSGNPDEDSEIREKILRHCRAAVQNPGRRNRERALFAVARKLSIAYGPPVASS